MTSEEREGRDERYALAAARWGPDLTRALWLLANEFEHFGWSLCQGPEDNAVASSITNGAAGVIFSGVHPDAVWALCFAIQKAADAGYHRGVPPPPPPPKPPEPPHV